MKHSQDGVNLFGALILVLTCAASHAGAHSPAIITIDVQGAGTAAGQGTLGFGVTPGGAVVGEYIDWAGAYHGFLRATDGAITTFDSPGAGTGPGEGTQPEAINPEGAITGLYTDSTGLTHGFVRSPSGSFTTFDAPGAGIPAGIPCSPPIICNNGTQAAGISPLGVVSGQYVDTNDVFHGFVRSRAGVLTSYDAPGAGTGGGQGTFVTFGDGINLFGVIVGGYGDSSGLFHGFVRTPDGAITSFDPTRSVFTDPAGVNDECVIAGLYAEAIGPYHSFIRFPTGQITTFNVSGAGTAAGQGTEAFAINDLGDIVGAYIDANGVNHGFLRTPDGSITKFDVPGAGAGGGQGTVPFYTSLVNAITGYYVDANGVSHGFLRLPTP